MRTEGQMKAVIFDMDGTLIDTEKYYRIVWPQALSHFGYEMTDEQVLSLRSLGQPYAPAYFAEMFGTDLDYYEVRAWRKMLMEEMIRQNGIEVRTGASELLSFLKKEGILTAVATATDMERTMRYLGMVNLTDSFDRIISAAMVEHGKPAPDIYLYACRQLGMSPSECVAVEDAPNGVLSAYRAGCRVVMVPDQTQPDKELEKLLYAKVNTLSEIRQLFE